MQHTDHESVRTASYSTTVLRTSTHVRVFGSWQEHVCGEFLNF